MVGEDKTPLYVFLTDKSVNPQIGGEIKWNFTKFLFDRNGKPIERFEPAVTPDSEKYPCLRRCSMSYACMSVVRARDHLAQH